MNLSGSQRLFSVFPFHQAEFQVREHSPSNDQNYRARFFFSSSFFWSLEARANEPPKDHRRLFPALQVMRAPPQKADLQRQRRAVLFWAGPIYQITQAAAAAAGQVFGQIPPSLALLLLLLKKQTIGVER